MKPLNRTIYVFLTNVSAVISLLFLIPSDMAKRRDTTLETERADQLFDRGWLPDIFPPLLAQPHTSKQQDLKADGNQYHTAQELSLTFKPNPAP